MAFVKAMNAATVGVNGADVYTATGIGDVRVALYTSLVRDLDEAAIKDFVDKAMTEAEEKGLVADYVRDLWLIAFQGRDIRGGKGERTAALTLLRVLIDRFPDRRDAVLALLPEYGCWRDLFVLAGSKAASSAPELRAPVIDLVVAAFKADMLSERPSLLAKWMPREGASLDKNGLVRDLAAKLFPDVRGNRQRLANYRRALGALCARLKVVERNMCGGTWSAVEPGSVPGRCLNLNRKAFLNQKVKGFGERSSAEDRRACAAKFEAHLEAVAAGKATVNGGDTVFPHTICRQVQLDDVDDNQMKLLEGQWAAIKEKVVAAGAMGHVLPMCDFSGSMSGIPLDVSMGLGILLSEVNHKAFRDCMLSFDEKPHWITFKSGMSLRDKCTEALRHGQGLSTNFEAAMELVLARLVQFGVPLEEAPEDIVVFTDMGFDAACGQNSAQHNFGQCGRRHAPWSTLVEDMKRRYAAAGYTMPRLVIWNLRSAYKEYHATVDEKGVLMLSGWSPSAMKVIMKGITVQTPYEGMRAVLDDERYDRVRRLFEA